MSKTFRDLVMGDEVAVGSGLMSPNYWGIKRVQFVTAKMLRVGDGYYSRDTGKLTRGVPRSCPSHNIYIITDAVREKLAERARKNAEAEKFRREKAQAEYARQSDEDWKAFRRIAWMMQNDEQKAFDLIGRDLIRQIAAKVNLENQT